MLECVICRTNLVHEPINCYFFKMICDHLSTRISIDLPITWLNLHANSLNERKNWFSFDIREKNGVKFDILWINHAKCNWMFTDSENWAKCTSEKFGRCASLVILKFTYSHIYFGSLNKYSTHLWQWILFWCCRCCVECAEWVFNFNF